MADEYRLVMSDHEDVYTYLKDLDNDSKAIMALGGALGLSYTKLKGMDSNLREMVRAWLRKEDEVLSRSGEPTWTKLADALEKIGQTGIAVTIRQYISSSGSLLAAHEVIKHGLHGVTRKRAGDSLMEAHSDIKKAKLAAELPEKQTVFTGKRKTMDDLQSSSGSIRKKPAIGNGRVEANAETETSLNKTNGFKPNVTFEYLNLRSMNREEKEQLHQKLFSESEEIMEKYQKLFSATTNSMKQNKISVEEILCHLVGMSPARPVFKHSKVKAFGCVIPDLEEADSIDKVMLCVGKYSSFFCFQMLERIIENVGTKEDRDNLAKYKEDFRKYAERHVFMCPSEISEGNEDDHAEFYVALDDTYEDCDLQKVYKFVNDLRNILNIPPSSGLKLCRIEVGSLKLTFQLHFSLLKLVFPLTTKQEGDLVKLGVKDLWLIYHFSRKMHQEVITKASSSETDEESVQGADVVPTSLVSQPKMIISSKDNDCASIADSGHGTSISTDVKPTSRYKSTCIDSASVADSGHGTSIFSDPVNMGSKYRTDSSSFIDSRKAIKVEEYEAKQMDHTVASKEPDTDNTKSSGLIPDNSSEVDSEFYPADASKEQSQDLKHFNLPKEYKEGSNTDSLHNAAACGDLKTMRYLIEERDCNPANPGKDGLTPIHIAAQQNQLEVVKFLVEEQKIDPNMSDEEGFTPLHRACEGGSLKVICYLIDQLKEYMRIQDIISEKTQTGNIALHFASLNGHLEVVEHFISELYCNPNIQGSQGRTALHYATEGDNLDIVRFLIEKAKCDPSQCTGGYKMTPLHIAAKFGWLKIVKYLSQEQKCNVKCKNSDGDTPLNIAAFNGHLEIVNFFISVMKCDPYTPGAKLKTPMHNAAQGGHLDIIKHLIEVQKCDPSRCFGEENVTPLHDAARAGQLKILKYLIQEKNCNPLSRRSDGETPLNDATYGGHLDIVDFFISELKCDPNTPGEKGRIPLHLAVQQGHMHIVKYLVEKQECDPSYSKGEDRVTPLHVAAFFGRLDMAEYLTQDNRCDPLSKNARGETALNDAALKGAFEVVKYFISELKCDPNSTGEMGRVPLHLAAQGGHMDLVKYLTEECNCDSEPFDDDNMTPLHLAAMYGHLDAVKCLVYDRHCNPMIQDSYAFTPLHYAARDGRIDVAKYFIATCKCPLNVKEYRGYTPLKIAEIQRHTHIVNYLQTLTSE